MWFSFGFCIASAVCAYLYNAWILLLSLLSAVCCLGCFAVGKKTGWLRVLSAVLLGLATGFSWFWVFDRYYLQRARLLDEQTQSLLIVVDDYSEQTNYGCCVGGTVYVDGVPYRVWTYLNDRDSAEPGDLIRADFYLRFTADGKDVAPVYRGTGRFLVASQRGDEHGFWHSSYFRWYHYPAVWRNELKNLIRETFPEDTAPFAIALLLGDRSQLDYETETALKISGVSHIIAVSGLHVSILFGLLYLLTAKRRVLTALVGIPVVMVFAAIAGFSPSVTRACLMQILMMLAMLFNREYDSLTALAFAALVMLGVNPLTVTSVSFQLSAGCMTGIFLFCSPILQWMMDKKRLGRWKAKSIKGRICSWFSGSVSVTLSAMVFSTALVAYYFGTVSIVGVLTNLLTLWAVTVIFYGILHTCLLGILFPSAAWIGWIISWLIRYVIGTAKMLASFPYAAVYVNHISIVIWLVFCYLLLGIFLLRKNRSIPVLLGSIAVSLLIAIVFCWVEPTLDTYRITVMDVGQGQSILIQSEGRTFLVDCGGDNDEIAADTAAQTLLTMGITKIDGVILTHYDMDHSGGIPYLLTRVDAEQLYLPYSLDSDNQIEKIMAHTSGFVNQVKDDTVLSFGSCKLTIFAPDSYNSGNESSMCILFETESCDILITGDRGTKGEQMLLKRHELPDLEILVAGHHGAADSVSEELLNATKPEYVAISVGEYNRYGHPSQEVLERLEAYGCRVYRTDRDGSIVFRG